MYHKQGWGGKGVSSDNHGELLTISDAGSISKMHGVTLLNTIPSFFSFIFFHVDVNRPQFVVGLAFNVDIRQTAGVYHCRLEFHIIDIRKKGHVLLCVFGTTKTNSKDTISHCILSFHQWLQLDAAYQINQMLKKWPHVKDVADPMPIPLPIVDDMSNIWQWRYVVYCDSPHRPKFVVSYHSSSRMMNMMTL